MKTKSIVGVICLVSAALFVGGCEMMQPQAPAPAQTVSYDLPVLTPVEPEKQDQETNGIRISVAGYTYEAKQIVEREYKPSPTIFVINNQFPAQLRELPRLVVSPKEVRFKVKIYNRLDHVLRLAGTAVSFQVAGKSIAVNKSGYEDFLNGIILPRQEGEYEISGPPISQVPANTTIGFFLYDIVTVTDAAGNPTQRSNFEFYYTVSKEAKTESVSATTRQVYLNQAQANLLMERSGTSSSGWVAMPEFHE